ncbi:hypothetical protein Sar04_47170 [Salinispora arenicola]|uniref:Uncharacterized protein n=1 Tax=Salinispora arenicola TaxID=168697 RepID=A0ABQ4JYH7_SALAC|nr:hypothetical protein Sar04_47170 [Salinispora arenicola]
MEADRIQGAPALGARSDRPGAQVNRGTLNVIRAYGSTRGNPAHCCVAAEWTDFTASTTTDGASS